MKKQTNKNALCYSHVVTSSRVEEVAFLKSCRRERHTHTHTFHMFMGGALWVGLVPISMQRLQRLGWILTAYRAKKIVLTL